MKASNLATVSHISSAVVDRRIDIVCIISATMSNPQGDPDSDNAPRVDDNGYGFVTPQGFRRKIRDLMALRGEPIYIARKAVLATQLGQAVQDAGYDISPEDESDPAASDNPEAEEEPKKGKKKGKDKKAPKKKLTYEQKEEIIRLLTRKFKDVRLFGDALMAPINEPIHGPIQFSYATSVEPVTVQELAITRVAVTREEDAHKERAMGRNFIIPFAVYRLEISVNPFNAKRTGMTWGEYEQFLQDLQNMFETSKAGGRFGMVTERVIEFQHDTPLGRAPAHKLFRRVTIERKNPDEKPQDELGGARSLSDYTVGVN